MAPMTVSASLEAESIAGRREATFELFFGAHHDRLFRAVWLLTRGAAEAEEVVQEAFLKVWERWDRVAVTDNPEGYLYRTAMNVFRNRLRRAKTALRHATPPGRGRDGLGEVEARDEVLRALRRLPPRQRAAVVLMDALGFASDDAARMLGVRASTVRALASNGRGRLREVFADAEA